MMKPFVRNLARFLIVGLIPMLILTIGYIYFDPFKVLKPYKDYSYAHVIPNRDYISTEMFYKNFEKQQYNSFEFGSSRTIAFRPSSWRKYLPPDAKPFMFDAHGESIYGIYTKLKFLDSLHIKINNALIILCRDASFSHDSNHEGHLFIKDPKVSGESNLDFQLLFYKAYLNPHFLFSFYAYTFSGKFKNYMEGYIENREITFDTITNEMNFVDEEQAIMQHPSEYYEKKAQLFYERTAEKTDTIRRINNKQLYMLQEVKRILEKNRTNYKVVLSPLYEQIKFNKADFDILKTLFGNNLYDFSGKNSFTDLKTNYYETMHYRPNVGDSIFKLIYK